MKRDGSLRNPGGWLSRGALIVALLMCVSCTEEKQARVLYPARSWINVRAPCTEVPQARCKIVERSRLNTALEEIGPPKEIEAGGKTQLWYHVRTPSKTEGFVHQSVVRDAKLTPEVAIEQLAAELEKENKATSGVGSWVKVLFEATERSPFAATLTANYFGDAEVDEFSGQISAALPLPWTAAETVADPALSWRELGDRSCRVRMGEAGDQRPLLLWRRWEVGDAGLEYPTGGYLAIYRAGEIEVVRCLGRWRMADGNRELHLLRLYIPRKTEISAIAAYGVAPEVVRLRDTFEEEGGGAL